MLVTVMAQSVNLRVLLILFSLKRSLSSVCGCHSDREKLLHSPSEFSRLTQRPGQIPQKAYF